jgi:hypothetical protein
MPDELVETHRLEGSQTSPHRLDSGRLRRASRFAIVQLYRLAAGGSRARLHVMQFYRLSHSNCNGTDTMGKTSRWVVPGSRLFSLVLAGLAF